MQVIAFDLNELSEQSKDKLADIIADCTLKDRVCSICGDGFELGDCATVSGKNPLTVAHSGCWEKRQSIAH